MKSVTRNQNPRPGAASRVQMSSLMNLMVNDNYLFLDPSIRILEYSQNTAEFFRKVLNAKIQKGLSLIDKLINDQELAISFRSFLTQNIKNELVDVTIDTYGVFIQLHLNKVYDGDRHIGYNCILTQKPAYNLRPTALKAKKINEFSKIMTDVLNIGSGVISDLTLHAQNKNKLSEKLTAHFKHLHAQSEITLSLMKEIYEASNQTEVSITIEPRFTELKIKNILLLDDEHMVHVVTKSIIRSFAPEINVFSFTSTEEASEFLYTHPTDLILLNPVMPESGSWNFLTTIEKLSLQTPVVLSSSFDNHATLKRMNRFRQVKGILNRPINKQILLNILNF